jgi:hypothetical protein
VDPDVVDWVLTTREEQYWQWCRDNKEEDLLMGDEEKESSMVAMASRMLDETEVTKDLGEVRDGLFRKQFQEAFCFDEAPSGYWKELEKQWKRVSDGAPMPTKYRTNKSVILKAWRVNSKLSHWHDPKSGYIAMGKTAVQAKCMVAESVAKTPEAVATQIIDTLSRYETKEGSGPYMDACRLVSVYCAGVALKP